MKERGPCPPRATHRYRRRRDRRCHFYIMTKIKIDSFYLKEPFPELHQHKDHLLDLINQAECGRNEPIEGMSDRMPHTAKVSPINRLDWDNSTDYKNRPWVNFVYDLMVSKLNTMVDEHLGLNQIKFSNLWFQQYIENNFHNWHIHDCNFTGVYYVEMANEENNKTELLTGDGKIAPEVDEGDICIFPAFIIHRCPPIESTNRKTIISYNFDIQQITESKFQYAEGL